MTSEYQEGLGMKHVAGTHPSGGARMREAAMSGFCREGFKELSQQEEAGSNCGQYQKNCNNVLIRRDPGLRRLRRRAQN